MTPYVPLEGLDEYASASPHAPVPSRREPSVVWVIACTPLVVLALHLAMLAAREPISIWVTLIVILASAGGAFLLARVDRRQLVELGFEDAPHPGLALVTAIYLLVRASRKFDRVHAGFAPLWLHVLVVVVTFLVTMWGGVAVILLDMQTLDYSPLR